MSKDEVVVLLFLVACIYYAYLSIKEYKTKKSYDKKLYKTRESIIEVTVIYKGFSEGSSYSSTSGALGNFSRLPSTYMLSCTGSNNKEYTIYDEELYKECNLGDIITLKLIEKLDEYNFIVSYELKKLNNKKGE